MSLSEARKFFKSSRGNSHSGINPKNLIKHETSKTQYSKKHLYLIGILIIFKSIASKPQQIKQLIDADIIPLLGNIKLHTLKTIDVTQALDKIVQRDARVHANKVLAALKQAFGLWC